MSIPPPPREDDPSAVMAALGPILPNVLREGVDEGFYRWSQSRKADPNGFVSYGSCSRMNMLYDHIAVPTRELLDLAAPHVRHLRWRVSDNLRATEIYLDPYLAFRIKREKRNRGGRTTSVLTERQRAIKSPVALSDGETIGDPVPGD